MLGPERRTELSSKVSSGRRFGEGRIQPHRAGRKFIAKPGDPVIVTVANAKKTSDTTPAPHPPRSRLTS
ncbi:hypothetical protein [Streptomyces sp. NPDC086519]|uniref:hypothetical protein n=1 Tax=Streptomyces sp. NPDC086519 TaxID=3154863 RepID=UPI00342BF1B1